MALFEVLDEGMEIGEVEPTTCVVATLHLHVSRLGYRLEKSGLLTSSSCLASMASAFTMGPLSLSTDEDILVSLKSLGLERNDE